MTNSDLSRRGFLSGAALAAGGAGLASLATACGGSGSGDKNSIRVLAWSNGGTIDSNFKNRVTAFNAAQHGKVKATLQLLPYDQYWQKIDLAYSAHKPYDVYYWDVQAYAHYKKGLLRDLQPTIDRTPLADPAKYPDRLFTPWKFDGHDMYGFPDNVQTMALFYNKDLFDKAGVKYPDDSWTWDDAMAAAAKLTMRKGKKTTQWGIHIGDLSVWWGLQTLSWAQGTAFTDKVLEPKTFQMDDDRNVASIAFVHDLIYKHNLAPTPEETSSVAQDVGVFETGKVAMYPAGGWQVAAYQKLGFNWAMAPLPKFNNKRVAPYWLGGWMIPKSGQAQDAAIDFARWSATDFQTRMAKDHDWIPVRTADRGSAAMVHGMPAGFKESVAQLETARVGDIYHSNNLQIVDEVFTPTFEQVWNNKLAPKKAAEQIQTKGNALLKS
ncbi:MAG TPA: sugar ABC transporter substrate-binding protein [Mycobacteriales bacterium]|jgi:multiple sugar transport system substrate-binding protein|nr:sugar ABC transporter substrate-binding protein [Mycobacteriales bacterium]